MNQSEHNNSLTNNSTNINNSSEQIIVNKENIKTNSSSSSTLISHDTNQTTTTSTTITTPITTTPITTTPFISNSTISNLNNLSQRPIKPNQKPKENHYYQPLLLYNNHSPSPCPHSSSSSSSSDWIYDIQYLTISGGGVKGYVYAGALLTLDDAFRKQGKNLYQQLKGVSGTSVGSLYALFITLGVRGRQLINEVLQTDVSHVLHDIRIENLMEMYGLNSVMRFRQQIYDVLEKYTGKGDITFKELYDLTLKKYVCCLSNVSLGRVEYHSYLSTPNLKVFESVAASMSIPLLFVPSIINGNYYVDGGLLDNCPFSVFPPDENFIIYLEGDLTDLSSIQNYMLRIVVLSLRTVDETRFRSLKPDQQKRRLVLTVKNVSVLDFHVGLDIKKQLLIRGASQMEKFLHPNLIIIDFMKLIVKILVYKVIKNKHFKK